ncbi:MAG: peptide deformylase [Patescibacteria group bacterium]|nr:peptide deformylase [Patescibacteria group bacterium]
MKITRFGNPILRQAARQLQIDEIKRSEIQKLITDMQNLNEAKELGVGLAAPQVGSSVALAIIDIKPTKLRPNVEPYTAIIINPNYKGIGRRQSMWEGCLSSGLGKETLFAKALRYKTIEASWLDEHGVPCSQKLFGLPAQVFQHETDHLHGVLFVDKVRDTTTYMVADEYQARIKNIKNKP